MRSAVNHAVATGQPALTIASHSFELIERGARRPRGGVVRRFEALCETLAAERHEAPTRGFADVSAGALLKSAAPSRLPPNPVRTALRMFSQLPSRA